MKKFLTALILMLFIGVSYSASIETSNETTTENSLYVDVGYEFSIQDADGILDDNYERCLVIDTEFCKGWKSGYVNGYCHNRPNCITPFIPMCPTPKFNENYNSYKDGYHRGFMQGKAAQ